MSCSRRWPALPNHATAPRSASHSPRCRRRKHVDGALCENLTIAYPFWLAGTHPPECGYRAFEVACDKGNVSLKNSYWNYQVMDIFYENSSFIEVDPSYDTCDVDNFVNASSDLGIGP